jgi:GGDEF domain-containing protein
MTLSMPLEIGTREELLTDLTGAVAPGEPVRLLVVFRLGGFEEFASRYGNGATNDLLTRVVSHLPEASGPSSFYYRPRKDELCGLVAGRLDGVEAALIAAAHDVNETLGSKGLSLGFGTAILPHEAHDPISALAVADGRVIGVADGAAMPRGTASGALPLGMLQVV